MTRFQFRLDRVLRLREGVEKQRATDLGHALNHEAERRNELAAAESQLERAGQESTDTPGTATAAGALAARSRALQSAAEQVRMAAERAEAAERRTDSERDRHQDARRERQTLEKLRERRRETWKTETVRSEQKEQDEVARRRRTEGEER